ncbi:glycine zipper 2TM domain-containing protein [Povalibacter sp.]|uniref:glycine zipper 2TM domain-containing protein n=1 Tax=Povalibacter sp. TaxID=1962978 RepID=UPI002F403843
MKQHIHSSGAVALAAWFALTGCVSEPVATYVEPPAPPPPDTTVYFYPAEGRAIPAAQQDRDKYECNVWAVKQSGFDPSAPNMPPHHRVRVVAGGPPPGATVGAGAVTGAVVGAVVANPWESGRGALIGAVAGAAIGGIVESERAHEASQRQAQANADANGARAAALEQQSAQFRRAMSACLEGRGYIVR